MGFCNLQCKLVHRYSLCIFVGILLHCLCDVSVAYGPLSQINLINSNAVIGFEGWGKKAGQGAGGRSSRGDPGAETWQDAWRRSRGKGSSDFDTFLHMCLLACVYTFAAMWTASLPSVCEPGRIGVRKSETRLSLIHI